MKVMITGSFDPPTLGHMDIIGRASKMFGSVEVCVCSNSEKRYMFTTRERTEMVRAACAGFSNVNVAVCTGLVSDYAVSHGIDAIVKGVRSGADFEYECVLDAVNRSVADVETIFLPSRPQYRHLSSTVGREMIRYGRELSKFLPEEVIAIIRREK